MHDIHASLDVRAPSGAPIAGGKARRRGVSYSTKTTIVVSECRYVADGRARGLHAVYHRRMCSFVFAKKALVKKSDVGRTSHRGCSLCGCFTSAGHRSEFNHFSILHARRRHARAEQDRSNLPQERSQPSARRSISGRGGAWLSPDPPSSQQNSSSGRQLLPGISSGRSSWTDLRKNSILECTTWYS